MTLTIQSSGAFTLSYMEPGGDTEIDTGTLSFDSENEEFLLLTFDSDPGDELEFSFVAVNDNSFQLIDNTGEGEFDLDSDGDDEPARINSTWVR